MWECNFIPYGRKSVARFSFLGCLAKSILEKKQVIMYLYFIFFSALDY